MIKEIIAFEVKLLQEGITEDLVDLTLHWALMSSRYGMPALPCKDETIRCRVPVQRNKIEERIEQAREGKLSFNGQNSTYPTASSTGIYVRIVQLRIEEIRQESRGSSS